MKGKHITKEERFCIEKLLKQGKSYREIALVLRRGLGTIGDEIKRNGGRKRYCRERAELRRYIKQYNKKRKCNKVAMNRFLVEFVQKKLVLLWSPERISGRLKKEYDIVCSSKSVRKYIQSRSSLERYLFWKRVKKKTGKKRDERSMLASRNFIEQRPSLQGIGHWEGDFIVSSHTSDVLLVLVEKMSRMTKIRKLPQRNNALVNQSIEELLGLFERKTLTVDNDIAFQKWKQLSVPVYFTHPFSSWEKGLVENTNRWIRSFLPKRTDFSKISEEMIQSIEDWLNMTPRQCLAYKTPLEVYIECSG
jgi:IS30 family transposase